MPLQNITIELSVSSRTLVRFQHNPEEDTTRVISISGASRDFANSLQARADKIGLAPDIRGHLFGDSMSSDVNWALLQVPLLPEETQSKIDEGFAPLLQRTDLVVSNGMSNIRVSNVVSFYLNDEDGYFGERWFWQDTILHISRS